MSDPITEKTLGVDPQEAPKETPKMSKSSLKREEVQKDKEDEKMEDLARKMESKETLTDGDIENFLGWKRRKTIAMLEKEPKVNILIPFQVGEDENNPANQYAFFGINGVWIQVKKGDYVDVPMSIYKLHQASIRRPTAEESKATENLMRNIGMKIDPTTGKHKSIDALI